MSENDEGHNINLLDNPEYLYDKCIMNNQFNTNPDIINNNLEIGIKSGINCISINYSDLSTSSTFRWQNFSSYNLECLSYDDNINRLLEEGLISQKSNSVEITCSNEETRRLTKTINYNYYINFVESFNEKIREYDLPEFRLENISKIIKDQYSESHIVENSNLLMKEILVYHQQNETNSRIIDLIERYSIDEPLNSKYRDLNGILNTRNGYLYANYLNNQIKFQIDIFDRLNIQYNKAEKVITEVLSFVMKDFSENCFMKKKYFASIKQV